MRGAASETRTARQKTAANPLDVMLLRANRRRCTWTFGRWTSGLRNDGPGGHRLREDPRRLDPRRGLWIANRPPTASDGNGFLKLWQMQIYPIWVNRSVADLRPTYWESAHDGPGGAHIEFRDKMRKEGKLATP